MLVLACALLPLAACGSRDRSLIGASALAEPAIPLAWTVHRAQRMPRLETSSLESKQAAPGNQFVVLDVSVRNRATDPQVLSEGKLIAMDESQLQTFDTPVSLLSEDYLGLQVLSPAQRMHGKIAYEVPQRLSGVLFWSPGNGSKRILLRIDPPALAQRTLADAGADAAGDADDRINTDARPAPRIANRVVRPASKPEPARAPKRSTDGVAMESAAADPRVTRAASDAAPAPGELPAAVSNPPQGAPAQAAAVQGSRAITPIAPAAQPAAAPLAAERAPNAAARAKAGDERRRQAACAGLVSRNDPTEKQRSLGYFSQACRDYALPSNWQPQPARRSFLRRAGATIHRVVRSARAGYPVQ